MFLARSRKNPERRAGALLVEADKLAYIAWSQRMLGFRGPAQPSPMLGDATSNK